MPRPQLHASRYPVSSHRGVRPREESVDALMSKSENPQSYPWPQWHGVSALALMGNMPVSTAFSSRQWDFPFFFLCMKGHSTPVCGALSRHVLLLVCFVSSLCMRCESAVVDYDRRLCCRWVAQHHSGAECAGMPSLGIKYDDHFFSLFLQLLRIMKNLSAGVLFVFDPVSVQMVLSPQMHWPPYINRLQGSQTNKSCLSPPRTLYT